MIQFGVYLSFILIGIIFFVMNWLSQKTIQKYPDSFWSKRVVFIPIGMIIVTMYLFLLSWILPENKQMLLFVLFSPVLFYFIGLVAHATFHKVKMYNKMAAEKNPYSKKTK